MIKTGLSLSPLFLLLILLLVFAVQQAEDVLAQSMPDRERGQLVFNDKCAPCHADGPARPGTQALEIKYRDSDIPAVLEYREDLAPAYIKAVVRTGIFSMAPLRKTEVTDAELDDIAAYLSKNQSD